MLDDVFVQAINQGRPGGSGRQGVRSFEKQRNLRDSFASIDADQVAPAGGMINGPTKFNTARMHEIKKLTFFTGIKEKLAGFEWHLFKMRHQLIKDVLMNLLKVVTLQQKRFEVDFLGGRARFFFKAMAAAWRIRVELQQFFFKVMKIGFTN